MQKISKFKTASVYARAWLDAAKDKKIEDKAFEEAKLLKAAYNQDSALWNLLAAPGDDRKIQRKIIENLAKKTNLSSITAETLALIAENGKLKATGLILDEFIKLYYQDKGIVEVRVETAVELTAAQDKKLRSVLETKLKAPILLEYTVKPEVLGGLRVRFKSFLIDDTLESKLGRIGQLIKSGSTYTADTVQRTNATDKANKACRAGATNKTRRARETGRTNVTDRVKKGK